jgi:tripartite-type tricarboxylate transporter receptor subunit TctC
MSSRLAELLSIMRRLREKDGCPWDRAQTFASIAADDKVRERLVTVGVVVKGSTAAEFGTFMASEYKRWNAVREAAGIAQQ